jgi:hypothetical protein
MKPIVYTLGQHMPNTRLIFIQEVPRTNPKVRRATFQCACGNVVDLDIAWVVHLNTTSCGCYRSEVVAEKNTKHSHAVRENTSGAYRSWQAMHQRVKANPLYAHVNVCDRWSGDDGFANFIADMGDRPEQFSIERRDNSKGYEPSNCEWADRITQATNTSNTVLVSIGDETHSINEWCRIKGIVYHIIKQRRRRGMSIEDAITTPLNESKRGRKNGQKS